MPDVWSLLGECQSKCEHIAGVPLPPSTADRLHRLYLAKGILGTTAIEGNTLSEEDVLRFLDGKLELPPSREYLAQEIENIITGCGLIWKTIMAGDPMPLNAATFAAFNRTVLEGLALAPEVVPGEIRHHSVGVFRYRAAPQEDCEYLLNRLGEWLGGPEFDGPAEQRIALAIVKAIVAHLYLAWIHPYGDGNGRTARLTELHILLASGVPSPAAHLLSNHYNQTRTEYYRHLDYSSQSGGDITKFVRYAVQGLRDGLAAQLQEIRTSQLEITWRFYVHEQFSQRKSDADKRRRDLVLALSNYEDPVATCKLAEVSTEAAIAYNGKRMTLTRDMKELLEMNLVVRSDKGWTANKKLIEAFLPARAKLMSGLPIETPKAS
jgi:Fic family protein